MADRLALAARVADDDPAVATIVDLLRVRAGDDPAATPYHFIERPDAAAIPLTYGELYEKAQHIAASLQREHETGSRVLLLLPAGRAFVLGFFGCVLAGVVPVPAAPPSRSRLQRQLEPVLRIAGDCSPAAVLTTTRLADAVLELAPAELADARWHRLEQLLHDDRGTWTDPEPAPDDPVFLQYTSGSTRDPRGVIITHANLVANLATVRKAFATTPDDHAVVWLPPHHDMGLVGGLLVPPSGHFDITLLAPEHFVQSPVRWLQAITASRATISGGPNFGFQLCVDRIRDDQMDGLDLSSWRLAFVGAEPVRRATLDAFADRFGPVGFDRSAFYPCYGLAESTLFVTGGVAGAGAGVRRFDGRELISSGRTIDGESRLAIVDPDQVLEVVDGEAGEIWVRGPSVASGYFGGHTLSGTSFGARLPDDPGPFLRTGDVGFVVDGDLYVTGRLKDVIILNGRNLDAHDIEEVVSAVVPAHRRGLTAALSVLHGSDERLVIVQELPRSTVAQLDELRTAIQVEIARQFDVRPDAVVFTKLGALPRTTSGKIRRHAAAQLYANHQLPSIDHRSADDRNG